VKLVAAGWIFAAEVKTLVEPGQSPPLCAPPSVFFAKENLDLTGQQGADRSGAACGEDLGLLQVFSVEADRDGLLGLSFVMVLAFPRTCISCATSLFYVVSIRRLCTD
jgi:hypothetical protein